MRRQRTVDCGRFVRLALPVSVIAAFLLFILAAGIADDPHRRAPWKHPDFPDFSHYRLLKTLSPAHFPIHPNDGARIVAIGDLHAMNQSLSALLGEISYRPRSDTLIHLGDLVSKSKEVSSEPLLSFSATNRILGVRGNNDQKVIEWRAWMDWIASLPGGKEWLEDLDPWSHVDGDKSDPELDAWLKKSHAKWAAYVPSGWKLQGKHYVAARNLSQEHYDYLRALPLVLYAPTAHTYFVHAGLLPADPTRPGNDPKQPLSHLPTTANPDEDPLVLRGLQEMALLSQIPQNQDPWVLMNMRSLTDDGDVTDGKRGTPWSDLWNDVMSNCPDLPASAQPRNLAKHVLTARAALKCFPSMILYGHAAARDLDVKRWSVGVDTGCAYGRRLTAVILDANSVYSKTDSGVFDASVGLIPYGDKGTAKVVSVRCST